MMMLGPQVCQRRRYTQYRERPDQALFFDLHEPAFRCYDSGTAAPPLQNSSQVELECS
jgi:hypothetical protein